MTKIEHINCGTLLVPSYPTVVCHCLALIEGDAVALVDTGIGLRDISDPRGRLGQGLIDAAGYQFNERDTAVRRLQTLGLAPEQVTDIILTHADPDHAGGLADFPSAQVHLADEELKSIDTGHPRYAPRQFDHDPNWKAYRAQDTDWFGLPARRVETPLTSQVLLIPLPGHTPGHAGVAVEQPNGWFLHVGDAYYLRAELADPHHPVSAMAEAAAVNNELRLASLEQLRRIATSYADTVSMCGYHDISELPKHRIDWE